MKTGDFRITSDQISDLIQIFPEKIVLNYLGKFIQSVNYENHKLKNSLMFRISRITLRKIINKLMRNKVK